MSAAPARAAAPVWLAALSLGPFALLALDTGVALARGWSPAAGSVRLPYAVLALCAVGIVLGALARRRIGGRVDLALASLWLGLAAGDLLLGSAPAQNLMRFEHTRGPGMRRQFHIDPALMAGLSPESTYSTNSLGLRELGEPRAPRPHDVLCLGGSTTECTYIDDHQTWPAALERTLRAGGGEWSVGAAGISGYASPEHLDFLTYSPLRRTFGTVVVLVGINDFLKSLNGALDSGPQPLWRRSTLAHAVFSLNRAHLASHDLRDFEDEHGNSIALRRAARRQAQRRADLPDLTRALADYRRRIARMVEACARNGQRCLFLTQPVLWSADLPAPEEALLWLGFDRAGRYLEPGALRAGMDAFNGAMVDEVKRGGAEVVDTSVMSGDAAFFLDDCHFTEAGAHRLAELVAPRVATAPASR